MTDKDLTFEMALKKLEESADCLNRNYESLQDSIDAYENGMKYYNICKQILDNAEQKIEIYSE